VTVPDCRFMSQQRRAPAHRVAPSRERLPVTELTYDRAGAASPFGDDVTFPLPPASLGYRHPGSRLERTRSTD